MKTFSKVNKSLVVRALIICLSLISNYSYAQGLGGLLNNIKKVKDEVKKVTDDVKKTKDEIDKTKKEVNDNVNGIKNIVGANKNTDTTTNGNTANASGSGAAKNNMNGTLTNSASEQMFIKSIKIANTTGRKIFITYRLYDGIKDIGLNMSATVCEGKECIIDLSKYAYREYYIRLTDGTIIKKNALTDKGDYKYDIQANYVDDRGEFSPFSPIVSNTSYNGDDLMKAGLIVKIEKTAKSEAAIEAIEKQKQINKNAIDPTKTGTITIVNTAGGMGKIYCVLKVPSKMNSSTYKKIEFMLGENKGDKYVIKDLRLFSGCVLLTMPESEKSKDPLSGHTYIVNSLSGLGGADSFQMEDGIIAKVGEH